MNTTENHSSDSEDPTDESRLKFKLEDIIGMLICASHRCGIPLPSPNPPLPDLLAAVTRRISEHRARPMIDFEGGTKEWKELLQDYLKLQETIEKVIAHAARQAESQDEESNDDDDSEADSDPECGRDSQLQPLPGERASERPPGEERATPGRSPDDTRAIPGRDADDQRATPGAQPDDPKSKRAAQDAARAEYLAQLLRERTARSPIDDLPPERQQILFDLLAENPATIIVEMLAQPEPLGWNFKIGVSSLKRFRPRYRKQLEKAERLRIIAETAQNIQELGPGHAKVLEAAQNLIKMRFFDVARDPKGSDQQLQLLSTIVDRSRRTDLAERKINIDEQKAAQAE